MEFNLQSETKSTLPEKNRPPSYFSGKAKLRLGTLVVALGLVLASMNEARKPETWERLGFGATENKIALMDVGGGVADLDSPLLGSRQESTSQQAQKQDSSEDGFFDRFWNRLFVRIEKEEKQLLADRLVDMFAGELPVSDEQVTAELQKNLQGFYDEHQNLDAGITERLEATVDMLTKEKVALDAVEVKEDLQRVQSLLDKHAYALVEDQTSLNRSIESLAWNRTWQRVIAQTESAEFDGRVEPVSYLQLSGQPHVFRGQFISVEGKVRGAETISLPVDHKLGLAAYKVLWIKPVDSNRTPYCVYVRQLPDGFPDPGSQFIKMDESVTVNGIFFKLRSYEATNQQIETCPLIVADSIRWSNTPTVAVAAPQWQPPRWFLMLFMVAMPLVAGVLAFRVYRSTKSLRRNYDKVDNQVESNLKLLSDDPDIKTDWERVQDFVDADDHESRS